MAFDYEIKLPDGSVYDVSSETELTPEQAYNAAFSQAKPKSRKEQAEAYRMDFLKGKPVTGVEEFVGGAKHQWDKASLGLKGVFTDLSPEDKELLQQGRSFVKETGPASTAGEIVGDVAMSAGPVGRAARGAKWLSKAMAAGPKASTLTSGAASVLSNAGWGGLTEPEDREKGLQYGAAGAAGGHALTKAIAKLGRPAALSPITETMLEEGIPLTPGQAGGPLAKFLEGSLQNMRFVAPGLTKSIKQAQNTGQEGAKDFLEEAGNLWARPGEHGLTQEAVNKWIKGAKNINTTGSTIVPLTAIAAAFHIPLTSGATLAALGALYGTPTGRAFLMGQLPFQELLRQAPHLAEPAAQIGRAMAEPNTQLPKATGQ